MIITDFNTRNVKVTCNHNMRIRNVIVPDSITITTIIGSYSIITSIVGSVNFSRFVKLIFLTLFVHLCVSVKV